MFRFLMGYYHRALRIQSRLVIHKSSSSLKRTQLRENYWKLETCGVEKPEEWDDRQAPDAMWSAPRGWNADWHNDNTSLLVSDGWVRRNFEVNVNVTNSIGLEKAVNSNWKRAGSSSFGVDVVVIRKMADYVYFISEVK